MTVNKDKNKTARRTLTPNKILRAAKKMADKQGLNGLSMRQIAKKLGVEAMSLYHHFKNKEEILDGLVDNIYKEVDWSYESGNWQDAMRDRADKIRSVLKAHPWALSLIDSRTNPGPHTLGHHNEVLGCFRQSGFSIEMTAHAYALIDAYIFGFATQERNLPFDNKEEAQDITADIFADFPVEKYPYFVELAAKHYMNSDYEFASEFEFGFELILEGLERRRK